MSRLKYHALYPLALLVNALPLLFGCWLLVGCKPEPAPEYVEFAFRIPLQLTPIRETVAVGDTLWLTADFSDQLEDFHTGQHYPVTPDHFALRTLLGLFRLGDVTKPISQQPGATAVFKFVNQVGRVSPLGPTFSAVDYTYTPGRYQLRLGLIPQQPGVFCVNFIDGWQSPALSNSQPDLSYLVSGRTPEGGQRHAIFMPFVYGINQGQTNFALFQQHCLAVSVTSPTVSSINYEQKATFTFAVQ